MFGQSNTDAAFYVSLESFFNAVGRLAWAGLSDLPFLGRRRTFALFFTIELVLFAAMPSIARSGSVGGFVACVCIVLSIYGVFQQSRTYANCADFTRAASDRRRFRVHAGVHRRPVRREECRRCLRCNSHCVVRCWCAFRFFCSNAHTFATFVSSWNLVNRSSCERRFAMCRRDGSRPDHEHSRAQRRQRQRARPEQSGPNDHHGSCAAVLANHVRACVSFEYAHPLYCFDWSPGTRLRASSSSGCCWSTLSSRSQRANSRTAGDASTARPTRSPTPALH